jgi:hypothetical protein
VSRNVIIATNNLLIRAVYKTKTDSSGWPDLQVPRSGLVHVYCFYMFLRFDSHENRAGPVNGLPFEQGKISPFPAHMNTLSGPAHQTRLEIVSQHMLYSI